MAVEGIWRSRGYGWILKVDASSYALYDVTANSGVEFERGTRQEFEAGFDGLSFENQNRLSLRVRQDITRYEFERIEKMPASILTMDMPRVDDPGRNFNFFTQVFAQDYAFFKLRGVDWESSCADAKSSIDPDLSHEDLFTTLYGLIAPLEDNHVVLSDGKRVVYSEKHARDKALLRNAKGLTEPTIGNPENIRLLSPYLRESFLPGEASVAANGAIMWGNIAPGIAYLALLRFFGLADSEAARAASDLPSRRPDQAAFQHQDLLVIDHIMDQVMTEVSQADAVIVDVRLNGGGFDNVGMAIANRFADRKRMAFTKQARDGDGLTPLQEFFVDPAGRSNFEGPVYVLTSTRTASAGDVFALCMHALPHVTLVGQPSTGILSDNLKKHLPNGWFTSISNELYGSPGGQLYEGKGVPVDVETPVFVEDDFDAGFRVAVDTALELAAKQIGLTHGHAT